MRAYLGLGTNLGDREANLREAVILLSELGCVVQQSKVLETAPWGYADQPDFLNMALSLDTILPPLDLLRAVKRIEAQMGRAPAVRYGPRLIDIDLLLYGGVTMDTPELTLPHPRMEERDFVMIPLRELGVRGWELGTRPASES